MPFTNTASNPQLAGRTLAVWPVLQSWPAMLTVLLGTQRRRGVAGEGCRAVHRQQEAGHSCVHHHASHHLRHTRVRVHMAGVMDNDFARCKSPSMSSAGPKDVRCL